MFTIKLRKKSMTDSYDAILIVSFGGPEGPDDVMPFLENVVRGRNVPRERLLEVAEHYQHFGGVSPINQQTRDLIAALQDELKQHGPDLPIYWGNRNWAPMLDDTVKQMKADGIKHAIAFVVSGYSSYSSCRQYRENIEAAQQAAGEGAPAIDKIRVFYNHPLFIEAMAEGVSDALDQLTPEQRSDVRLIFTAHSLPSSMASSCDYEKQLKEASRLVSESVHVHDWLLVYQSRSGPPTQPWLEPDICDYLADVKKQRDENGKPSAVIIAPIGFLSDHIEVLFDLDEEAKEACDELKIPMVRAATVGVHPAFIRMVRDLIAERVEDIADRPAIGEFPANHDVCPLDCCPKPQRPQRPAQAGRPSNA